MKSVLPTQSLQMELEPDPPSIVNITRAEDKPMKAALFKQSYALSFEL